MAGAVKVAADALQGRELAMSRVLAPEQAEDAARIVVEALRAAGMLREQQAASKEDQAIYERFMHEFKQVGIWQGGKPVRAKLKRLQRDGKLQQVWDGLARLQADPNRPEKGFVPRPLTWLNQERWNDDPYPAKSGGRQAAAGAVLGIQLDGVREIEQRSPSIMGEMQQGRW